MKIRKAVIDDLNEISEIERRCFPVEEAATKESFKRRLEIYPDYFWILEDDDGKIISFVNGMATNKEKLEDEMFENPELHNEKGDWQMIFGVNTLPGYRKKGYAGLLLKEVIEDSRKRGRKGVVLTCKKELISYYSKLGFENEGKSESEHGGAVWYNMRIILRK